MANTAKPTGSSNRPTRSRKKSAASGRRSSSKPDNGLHVFIAHTSTDNWIAKQIAKELQKCGATPTLDLEILQGGDDIKGKLTAAISECQEFVVLLTPWGIKNHNLSSEVGAAAVSGETRIIAVTHNVKPNAAKSFTYMLENVKIVEINDLETYFEAVKKRVLE